MVSDWVLTSRDSFLSLWWIIEPPSPPHILLSGLMLVVSSVWQGAGASSRAGLSSVSVINCHQNEHLGSCLDPHLGVSSLHSFPERLILSPRGGYIQR